MCKTAVSETHSWLAFLNPKKRSLTLLDTEQVGSRTKLVQGECRVFCESERGTSKEDLATTLTPLRLPSASSVAVSHTLHLAVSEVLWKSHSGKNPKPTPKPKSCFTSFLVPSPAPSLDVMNHPSREKFTWQQSSKIYKKPRKCSFQLQRRFCI